MPSVTAELPTSVTVGNEASILVTVGDDAGTGPLNVSVKAQLTPQPLEVKDNGNKTMSVVFKPRTNGKHEFNLKWGDDAIEGSPFAVEVEGEVTRDASKVTVEGFPTGAEAEKQVEFNVSASDEAGPGPLMVDAEGPAEPEIELVNVSGGNFKVNLKCPKAGEYKLELFWGEGNAVPGSPFTLNVA